MIECSAHSLDQDGRIARLCKVINGAHSIVNKTTPGQKKEKLSSALRYHNSFLRRYKGGSPSGRVLKRGCAQKYCPGHLRISRSMN